MHRSSIPAVLPGLALLLAAAAVAQPADPDPDQLGLYWDLAASEICLEAAPFSTHTVHLCYTRPSVAAVEVCSFEVFYVALDGSALDLILRAPLGGAFAEYPAVWVPDQGPLAVGYSTGAPGPSARINGDCRLVGPVRCTWDAVKGIYR